MKGFGIALVGLLAIAGGVAAATIITKKKLEKENDEDYYDDWDEAWDSDDADFDFDEDEDITDSAKAEPEEAPAKEEIKKTDSDMVEEEKAPEASMWLKRFRSDFDCAYPYSSQFLRFDEFVYRVGIYPKDSCNLFDR